MRKLVLALLVVFLLLFLSGCVEHKITVSKVAVKNNRLALTLNSNFASENIYLAVVDEDDEVLCAKYFNAVEGEQSLTLNCPLKEDIAVIITSQVGTVSRQEFHLTLPAEGLNPFVQIKDAAFELDDLSVELESNQPLFDGRIDVVDSSKQVLCSKYVDLVKGRNQFTLTDCGLRETIVVHFSHPQAGMTSKEFSFSLEAPSVIISDVALGEKVLEAELIADQDAPNTRIELVDADGKVLCTRYVDLDLGENTIAFDGCQVVSEFTLSVQTAGGELKTKQFSLDLPLLDFVEGKAYVYEVVNENDKKREFTLYIDKVEDHQWDGTTVFKFEKDGVKKAVIQKFNVPRTGFLKLTDALDQDALDQKIYDLEASTSLINQANVAPFALIISSYARMMGINLTDAFGEEVNGPMGLTLDVGLPETHQGYRLVNLILNDENSEVNGNFWVSTLEPHFTYSFSTDDNSLYVQSFKLKTIEDKTFDPSEFADFYLVDKNFIDQALIEADCQLSSNNFSVVSTFAYTEGEATYFGIELRNKTGSPIELLEVTGHKDVKGASFSFPTFSINSNYSFEIIANKGVYGPSLYHAELEIQYSQGGEGRHETVECNGGVRQDW